MCTRVLITGFNIENNASHGVVQIISSSPHNKLLHGKHAEFAELHAVLLPSNFYECIQVVTNEISKLHPDVILLLGEYPGRNMITVERFTTNFNDSGRYGFHDLNHITVNGYPTNPKAPLAYRASLPIKAMVKAMRDQGIPADISDTAGTSLCNHLMFGVLDWIATSGEQHKHVVAGLVHLPFLPQVAARVENLNQPSMSVETSCQGVIECVKAILNCLELEVEDISEELPSRLQI